MTVMSDSYRHPKTARPAIEIDDLAAAVARGNIAGRFPAVQAGSSYVYELPPGWERDVLMRDDSIRRVRNSREMDDAYSDAAVQVILIPKGGAVTREAALMICEKKPQGKTVFFEVDDGR